MVLSLTEENDKTLSLGQSKNIFIIFLKKNKEQHFQDFREVSIDFECMRQK